LPERTCAHAVCTYYTVGVYRLLLFRNLACISRASVAPCLRLHPWASAYRGKWGQLTPCRNGRKIKKRKHAKESSFLCLCYILSAIRTSRCRERRYADHIFIQIYFRMHHIVVKFSNFLRLRRQGGIDPLTNILRTLLVGSDH